MISFETARRLMDKGIDPDSSFEDFICRMENLGYHGIYLSRSLNGFKITIMYQGNTYVHIKILADNRKEAVALALLISEFLE
ncbi:MAG: hypothetical protein CVU90_05115 [Firmicutes bacterium HGW-Firmicutes-15]|nr:MAG: hypothetical protein CVU90_05115 [Firmicutes bacterium HGW-Firmicutes-15]